MSRALSLNRARTTLQRTTDAKVFHGWVSSITFDALSILTATPDAVSTGDEFVFQVFGHPREALFTGRVTKVRRADCGNLFPRETPEAQCFELACSITSKVALRISQTAPRFFVESFTAYRVESSSQQEWGVVVEVGPQGFSLLTDTPMEKDTEVKAVLYTPSRSIHCGAIVRSCLPFGSRHRLGMQLQTMSRLDSLAWESLYAVQIDNARITEPVTLVDSELNRRTRRVA